MVILNIKQILTSMIMNMREKSLLGSYKQREYSKGFQKLMNNVVAKIYRSKANKNKALRTFAPLHHRQPQANRISTKISFSQQINKRKNSQTIASFCLSFPRSNGFSFHTENNKYSLPSFKIPDERNQKVSTSSKKAHSLPHYQYQISLFQKINDYNNCLITKTYRFQDQDKLAACLDEAKISQQSPSSISKIKKCQNFRKNNRWIHSKGKFIKQNTLIEDSKEDFRPWQFDQAQQLQY